MASTVYWQREGLADELAEALATLAEEYPLKEREGSPSIEFSKQGEPGTLEVARRGDAFAISYGSLADALRGVGAALAGIPEEGTLSESRPFSTFGIMLDCSRNAVMKVEHVKKWLRRLSLFGYNMVMLYTEDTYELPDEPFFGFLRGAYSPDELKEIDAYAGRLGIEMIGCIQTLGHLEQILKWGAYGKVKDTSSVMLAGEDTTYDLIRKMVSNFASCFRSRRVHVGMDETHDLGRGRYMDLKGYRRGFDIFNEHLAKVIGICREQGLGPMIWSDMYFRLGSKSGGYYDPESVIPDDVKAAIPEGSQLVYWDYYHQKEEEYLDMIERHRDLGREPVMGSGVWTWARLWYDRRITEKAGGACVEACRKAGLKELFFTMWGDDGGYCEYDSALAGLAWAAEKSYGGEEGDALKKRFKAACGTGYDETLLGCGLEDPTCGGRLDEVTLGPACNLLWDDPILGMYWLALKAKREDIWQKALEHFTELAKSLQKKKKKAEPVDMAHAYTMAKFFVAKIQFRMRLEEAYSERDEEKMKSVVKNVPTIADLVDELLASFRRQWYRRSKPFGFEVIQIRLGGLKQRYEEVGRALKEILKGERERFEELEAGLSMSKEDMSKLWIGGRYRSIATSSCIL